MTLEQTTAASIKATDAIIADIKKRGEGMKFLNKTQKENMRQDWISIVAVAILEESR